MAVTRGFTVNQYGQLFGEQLTATPTYPDVAVASEWVGLVEPYVNSDLGISNGAKIIFANASMNNGMPTAVVTATTVADVLTAWTTT